MAESDLKNNVPPNQSTDDAKLVHVGESIKYRRRAQQAEGRLQEMEKQLAELQRQADLRNEALAMAEAQRDEASHHLTVVENRTAAEIMLAKIGAVDVETALILLEKKIDFNQPLERTQIAGGIEKLLLDKPFLRSRRAVGPLPTAGARRSVVSDVGRITDAAQKAAVSGDRRDVAEYLRLRRQAAMNGKGC